MSTPAAPQDLRPTLDAIGNTATVAADLVGGLDEQALRASSPGAPSCSDILQQLVDAGAQLGNVAHDVLGHVPGAAAAYTQHPERPSGEQLLQKLGYLRAHIVSTVDQQGAAVWSTLTPAGRPLFAYAVDLQENDIALIDALRQAATRARQS
jgi:hypothetical protein